MSIKLTSRLRLTSAQWLCWWTWWQWSTRVWQHRKSQSCCVNNVHIVTIETKIAQFKTMVRYT